jgi:hypothetical protein
MRNFTLMILCTALLACGGKPGTDDTGTPVDADNDGFVVGEDCDDNNADVNPDAVELCDSVDNNCDGVVDEETAEDAGNWYADSDEDGFGDLAVTTLACEAPSGYVADSTDCDDSNTDISPDGTELCNGVDDDCDSEIDEDATDMSTWYADADADGFGDMKASSMACEAASGTVDNGDDCDDTNGAINPDAAEICDGVDNDCDAATLEDGLVTWTDAAGVASDVTADLTGTSTAPVAYTHSEGDLSFCDGTYYVNLTVDDDATLGSHNEDPTTAILDGGAQGTVVLVVGDGLSVALTDLTLQNGLAVASEENSYSGGGGGLMCAAFDGTDFTSLDLSLSNVLILNNEAPVGGGFAAIGCDLDFENVEISGNVADNAGGFLLYEGTHNFTGVDISDNVADEAYGAGLVYGYLLTGTDAVLDLQDVIVSDNLSTSMYGGLTFAYGALTWTGSTGAGDSGAWSNTGAEGSAGGLMLASSTFTATLVDFGNSADGTDNSSYDIGCQSGSDYILYWADDDASFTCDEDGCGTATTTVDGTAGSETHYSGLLGTAFAVNDTGTLVSFAPKTGGSCNVDYYLLSSTTFTGGTWTVEWASTGNSSSKTSSFRDSGIIGMPLDSALYYAVVWNHNGCQSNYFFTSSSGVGGTITGLGTTEGYVYKYGNITTTYSAGDAVSLSIGATTTWLTEFNVTEL